MMFIVVIAHARPVNEFQKEISKLEALTDGRLGVYAIDTANHHVLAYRATERFPMGCTSKVIGVGAILYQSIRNTSLLSQNIVYTKQDLVEWSPVTEKHVASGMSVAQLCQASIDHSDNTAMNLLVNKLGGLDQINVFARYLHNDSFRQDNAWPKEAFSGGVMNVEDSALPKDMVQSLQRLTLTPVLPKTQQTLLLTWLKGTITGANRMKAGVKPGWVVAHKTGTGSRYGTTNDLGLIFPPSCSPIVLGVYYTSDKKDAITREDVLASATRAVIAQFAQQDACLHKALMQVSSS
jgi:beta-lactamase class A